MPLHNLQITVVILLCALLSACSISEEDTALTESFVEAVRTRDGDALQAMVSDEVWQNSAQTLWQAAEHYPEGDVATQMSAYSINMESLDDNARTTKVFTLVTIGDDEWTETQVTTVQQGGDTEITAWNVRRLDEEPEGLGTLQTMQNVGRYAQVGGIVLVVIIVGVFVWLFRRGRRKRTDADPS